MAVGVKKKPEISRYLPENTKTGDFNPRRTLSGLVVVIEERLASIRNRSFSGFAKCSVLGV